MRALAGLLTLLVAACGGVVAPHVQSGHPSARSPFVLPDHRLTPGVVATRSLAVVCHTATSSRRQVSAATKAEVYARYGLPVEHGDWEIDHLIPLELGGSNVITNLWPEPGAIPNPKDHLEGVLHRLVCAHRVSLHQAQVKIAADWVAAYKEYR